MNRCSRARISLSLCFALSAGSSGFALTFSSSAAAQTAPTAGLVQTRNFPENALRGQLRLEAAPTGGIQAQLNRQPVTLAPGFRLWSPQNGLVPAHQALNTNFIVNYVLEASTGYLLTSWMLSDAEAAQKRAGHDVDATQRNFRFGAD